MLNQETKRKIDSARDILVGKVPDPKAQVEQITTAMIYKFMDDMDKEAVGLGGKASFFTNGFEKYSWSKIVDPKMGGQERLEIYSEAVIKMSQNPHIPQLFRDIFKDAFLPYRNPETLNLFLKEINGFHYEHSEDLGDAFEYLLSILGSQGDAGQFRTPRHIIDFIVSIVDPKKDETILDPACGTAGFLISAYKHILKQQKKPLTPDEKERLMKNFVGYDISPDMVKLSKVNMYLHGFVDPKIYEYDTLSSEERWEEMQDVIMANPPFMTPKGGIRPHKRFSVQANRAEVLFVDYIKEHLRQNGRAGIIVPEGIIFKNDVAYKQLRKLLVEDGLIAVISLPAGVFQPYSGVKTSILFFDNLQAKLNDKIIFIKINNDGYDLGAQRRPIDKNDLSEAIKIFTNWKTGKKIDSDLAVEIEKNKIINNGDYCLLCDRYCKITNNRNVKWQMSELDEVIDYEQPTKYIVNSIDYNKEYSTPVLTAGKTFILGYTDEKNGIFPKELLPVIIFDDFTTAIKYVDFPFKVKSSAMKILHAKKEKADIKYLYYIMQKIRFSASEHKRYWISQYSKIKVPLPPLEVQKGIVEEMETYQKMIDGAKQIVDNYKPTIKNNPNWEMVKIGDVCLIERGGSPRPIEKYISKDSTGINWVKIGDTKNGGKYITKTAEKIIPEGAKKSRKVNIGDFVLSNSMSFGRPYIMKVEGCIHDGWLRLSEDKKRVNKEFLYYILSSNFVYKQFEKAATGGVVKNLNSELVRNVEIPLPSIDIQKKIVEQAEIELKCVNSAKEIIMIFENKIKEKIGEIWGE